MEDADDRPIEELDLGARTYNALKRAGIATVGDLVSRSRRTCVIPQFGKTSLNEVRQTLGERSLQLSDG